jgi:hypothetical protein
VTVGIDQNVLDGLEVLDYVAKGGYAGVDLGPVAYLWEGAELHHRLSTRRLPLAGGYVPLPFKDPDRLRVLRIPGGVLQVDGAAEQDNFAAVRRHMPSSGRRGFKGLRGSQLPANVLK